MTYTIHPSVSGDPDKLWVQCSSGEGGDFDRIGVLAAKVESRLHEFFWENF